MSREPTPEYLKRVNAALALREIPDYEPALAQLEKAVALAPSEGSVRLLMGLTYQDLGRWQEAENQLREAWHLEPEEEATRQALGIVLFERGEIAEAVRLLAPLIAAESKARAVWQTYATALKELGRIDEALETLQGAFERWPEDASIANQYGHLLLEQDRPRTARPVLEHALSRHEGTGTLCDLAIVHQMEGDDRGALQLLERAVERRPESSRAWRGIADCHLRMGHPEQALVAAEKSVKYDPDHFRSWQIMANVLLALGRAEEAFGVLDRGITLAAEAPEGQMVMERLMGMRAIELLKRDGAAAALAQLEADLEQVPEQGELLKLKLDILMASGEHEAADTTVQALLAAGVPASYLTWERYQLAHAAGRPEEALALLETVLVETDLTPDLLAQMQNSGMMLYGQGKPAAASAVFEQILTLAPGHPDGLNNLGFILAGEEEWERSATLLQQAAEAGFPERSLTQSNLGYVYLRQGAYDKAIQVLEPVEKQMTTETAYVVRIACWCDGSFCPPLPARFPRHTISALLAARANLALAYYLQGAHDRGLETAEAAVAAAPESPWGYIVHGCLLQAEGEETAARAAWKQAQKLTQDRDVQDRLAKWLATTM